MRISTADTKGLPHTAAAPAPSRLSGAGRLLFLLFFFNHLLPFRLKFLVIVGESDQREILFVLLKLLLRERIKYVGLILAAILLNVVLQRTVEKRNLKGRNI